MMKIPILLSFFGKAFAVLSNKGLFDSDVLKEFETIKKTDGVNYSFGILKYIMYILNKYKGDKSIMKTLVLLFYFLFCIITFNFYISICFKKGVLHVDFYYYNDINYC